MATSGRKPKYSDDELIEIVKECYAKERKIMNYSVVAATAVRLGYRVTYKDFTRPNRLDVRKAIDQYNETLKQDSFSFAREFETSMDMDPVEFLQNNRSGERLRQAITFLFDKIKHQKEVISHYQKENEALQKKLAELPAENHLKNMQKENKRLQEENRYLRKWIDHNLNLKAAQQILNNRKQKITVMPKELTETTTILCPRALFPTGEKFSEAADINVTYHEFLDFLHQEEGGDKNV